MCIEVCPSHATETPSISAAREAVEAPYLDPHAHLPASTTVLSLWSVVAVCALIPREKFKSQLESHAGTSSYFQAGTGSYHALCNYENIEYVDVPEEHLYNTYECMNAVVFAFLQLFSYL